MEQINIAELERAVSEEPVGQTNRVSVNFYGGDLLFPAPAYPLSVTTVKVRIHDISLGGCLIEAPLPVQVGRRITLRLICLANTGFHLEGETVRVQGRSRLAVKFLDLDVAKQGRLQQVIEHLTATSPAAGSTRGGAADV